MTETQSEQPRAPIENRYATVKVDSVDFAQRIVTVVAVPYESPALVPFLYRGEVRQVAEVFSRGSLDDVASAPHRVRVNRDHDKSRTIGKAMQFWPEREEGLVTDIRIAQTLLGDETLALADEDMISVSVGFGVLAKDQVFNPKTMTRRINKAYLDHIAFVESPAYADAKVLSVRKEDSIGGLIHTPALDEFMADPYWQWTNKRLNTQ